MNYSEWHKPRPGDCQGRRPDTVLSVLMEGTAQKGLSKMASPFAMFRKNQQTLLVLLFILAMFAFIFLGNYQPGQPLNLPMLCMLLGTTVLTVVGVRMRKPFQYAVAGAVGGLLVGYIASYAETEVGGGSLVETKIGNLNDQEFAELAQQRNVSNQFISQAMQTALDPQTAAFSRQRYGFSFGTRSMEEEVVLGMILRDEAQKAGVIIDKNAVTDYINLATQNKLSRDDYRELLRALGVSDSELYDMLKSELTAKVMRSQIAPPPVMTPDKYWDLYKKLQVTQYLQTVAVPVEPFVSEVKDPSEAELQAYFEKYKDNYPRVPKPDSIGFRQPRKVQVAYVEATYLDLEQQVGDITDAEIETFYEDNKDILYMNRSIPDSEEDMSDKPEDDTSEPTSETEEGSTPPLLFDPNQSKPKTESETPAKPETPAADEKPADADPDTEKPAEPSEESPKPDSKPQDDTTESSATAADPTLQNVVFVQEETDKPATEESPTAEESDKPAAEKTDEKPAEKPAEETPEKADEPAKSLPPTPDATATEDKPLQADKPETERPKYRPLDEFLRYEIEELLLRERTRELQIKLSNQVFEVMQKLSNDYFEMQSAPAEEKTAFIKKAREQVKTLAKKLGLNYAETPAMSYQQLMESDEHPVGSAAVGEGPIGQNPDTVADKAFGVSRESVYEVDKARSMEPNSIYVFWKTADIEDHVPTFDEKGIREEVLEAWKRNTARPLAKKRADELVKELTGAEKSWAELLVEETVKGAEEGLVLSTFTTERFSWIRTQSVPTQFGMERQIPELSTISAIDRADNQFMKTIFLDMNEDDIRVVPNADKSIYYVVQVRGRQPSTETQWEAQRRAFMQSDLFMANMFMPSPISILVQQSSNELSGNWYENLMQEYNVVYYDRNEREN